MQQRGKGGYERGQGLAEFALVLPVLLFVVMAIIEFGNIFFTQLQLQNAVHDAVHYAALGGASGGGCPSNYDIQSYVQQKSGLNLSISSTYNPTPCTACSGASYPEISISGKDVYTAITPVGAFFRWFGGSFNDTMTLTSSASMLNEACPYSG